MKLAELFVRLTADTRGFKSNMTDAERSLGAFGKTSTTVERQSGRATQGIGRLGNQFGTLLGQMTGVNPTLLRIGSTLATFGSGAGPVAIAIGGLTVMAGAWTLITRESRAAGKEMKDALAHLKSVQKQEAQGVFGATGAALTGERNKGGAMALAGKLSRDLAREQGRLGRPGATFMETELRKRNIERLQRQYNEAVAAIKSGERAVRKAVEDANAGPAIKPAISRIREAMAKDLIGVRVNVAGAVDRAIEARNAPSAPVPGNFEAFAAVPQEFRAGQTADGRPVEQNRTLGGAIKDQLAFTGIGQLAKSFAEFGPMAIVLPLINKALEALAPLLESVGDVVGIVLAPALKIMGAIIKGVVWALSWLMEGLGFVVKGLGKLIDSLPFVSAKGIIRMGQDMIDAARAARKNTDATDKATDAVEKFAGSLSNIPRVLNVNALRHMVTGGGAGGGGIVPSGPRDTGPWINTVNINVNGAGDPRRVAEEVGRAIERTGSRGGMTRLQVALA